MTDIERAKAILLSEGCTCVFCKGDTSIKSHDRGVKPLLLQLDSGTPLCGASAADKVVGKGAAFLYVLLGVSSVHACVISTPAMEVLTSHGISVTLDKEVAAIRNRTDTGFCPIESAVLGINDPQAALEVIRKRVATLNAKNK